MSSDPTDETSPDDRYAYKASLIGSAHLFELTRQGLSWKVGARSGVWAYTDISAINLSFRPSSMQSSRFRADIRHVNGARIKIMSTNWQTVSLMVPQDQGYRGFMTELHRRMAAAGSRATLRGGLALPLYAAAVVLVGLLAIAMLGLLVRAVAVGEWAGVLFFLAFAALFYWQIGGFIRRNRPVVYTFDQLPKALLP